MGMPCGGMPCGGMPPLPPELLFDGALGSPLSQLAAQQQAVGREAEAKQRGECSYCGSKRKSAAGNCDGCGAPA